MLAITLDAEAFVNLTGPVRAKGMRTQFIILLSTDILVALCAVVFSVFQ